MGFGSRRGREVEIGLASRVEFAVGGEPGEVAFVVLAVQSRTR